MRRSVWLFLASAILLLAGLAAAQTTPPATGPDATIRTTSTEVLLDVAVTDKHGKNVKNLKQGDVEVYEDGVKQAVTSFRLAGRDSQTQQPEAAAGTAAGTSQTPRPLRAVNLICIVFHNIDPIARKNATQAVREFLKDGLPAGAYVGMFLLSDRLTPIMAFTADRDKANQAAEQAFNLTPLSFTNASVGMLTANPNMYTITTVMTGGGGPGTTVTSTGTVTGGEISNTVFAGADVSNGAGANALRGDEVGASRDFANLTGGRAEDAINNLIKALGTLPGRKTILMLTQGLLTTGDPDALHNMLTKAIANGITFYPVDITGLTETSTVQAANLTLGSVAKTSATQSSSSNAGASTKTAGTSSGGATTTTTQPNMEAMKQQSQQGDTMMQGVRASNTQASLRALAEGTGGFMIANSQDYAKPFSKILDNVAAHYEVSYRPTEDKYDGRLRKVEVKLLGHADDHAESRTGYFAMPDLKGSAPLQPFEVMGLRVLGATPPPHGFDFHTVAFHFQNEGANSHGMLYFEVPGQTLSAAAGANQTHEVHPSLMALVKDSAGQVVDKYSYDQTYRLADDKWKAALAAPVVYTHPLSLPAGHYTVETAVLDREAGRASTNVTQFDNPEMRGLGMSSLMAIQSVENADKLDAADPMQFQGKVLVPMLSKTAHEGTPYLLYFTVYPEPSNSEKPVAQVEVSADGKVLIPAAALKLTAEGGVLRGLMRGPAVAGNLQAKVTVSQGNLPPVTQTLDYTVVK
jgi:VWFA-related protein